MIEIGGTLRHALENWLRPRTQRAFPAVLESAIDELGTTQIRVRAYELERFHADSAKREAPVAADTDEREEKQR